jgi:hypothetical protein
MTERREAGGIVTRVRAVAPLEIRNEFAVVHLTKPAHLPEPDRIQPMPTDCFVVRRLHARRP